MLASGAVPGPLMGICTHTCVGMEMVVSGAVAHAHVSLVVVLC